LRLDTRKLRKTCAEVTGQSRTFRILTVEEYIWAEEGFCDRRVTWNVWEIGELSIGLWGKNVRERDNL
jgi:hypothetical protein